MKSLFANISIFLLVSAHIIFQTSTSAEAQQKPVSLLPETLNTTKPNIKSKAITPSQDTDSKNEVVQIDELKDLDLESTGVLGIESGGFSKDMWNGTSHSKAILLLKNPKISSAILSSKILKFSTIMGLLAIYTGSL